MMRHCDGDDPNLVRRLPDGVYVPCDCDLSFDDIDHSVVYPHILIVKGFSAVRYAIETMPDGAAKDNLLHILAACEKPQWVRTDSVGDGQ